MTTLSNRVRIEILVFAPSLAIRLAVLSRALNLVLSIDVRRLEMQSPITKALENLEHWQTWKRSSLRTTASFGRMLHEFAAHHR